MGLPLGRIAGVFLTHFHSDHIDRMGPLMLTRWTAGSNTAPLPVYGPIGVDQIVAGFNAAYAIDDTYRTGHHGPLIVREQRRTGENMHNHATDVHHVRAPLHLLARLPAA